MTARLGDLSESRRLLQKRLETAIARLEVVQGALVSEAVRGAESLRQVRVGDALMLARRPVTVDPSREYRLAGVYSFGRGLFHHEPKPGVDLGDYRFFALQSGDLVLSNIGAWEGGIALAAKRDEELIGNHRVLTYVPRQNEIVTTWAKWFFLSEPGMKLIRDAAPGTVMRNRTLAISRFESLRIPIPSVDRQRQLAGRLDVAERLGREVQARHAKTLQGLAAVERSTLRQCFAAG